MQAFAHGQGSTPSGTDDASHRLSVSNGRNTVVISEDISIDALDSVPTDVTTVRYTASYSTGAIDTINFRFSDIARTLEVSGQSPDQVEAAAELASMIIAEAEVTFGGARRRGTVGVLLFIVCIMLILAAARTTVRPLVGLAMLATGNLLAWSLFLFPWSEWFPGFAVYREDTSFLVRHGPLISVFGALITILGGVVGVVGFVQRLLARPASAQTSK